MNLCRFFLGRINVWTCVCRQTDAYTTEDLVFDWRKDAIPVEKNADIRLPEYDLKDVSHMVCSQNINSTGMWFVGWRTASQQLLSVAIHWWLTAVCSGEFLSLYGRGNILAGVNEQLWISDRRIGFSRAPAQSPTGCMLRSHHQHSSLNFSPCSHLFIARPLQLHIEKTFTSEG